MSKGPLITVVIPSYNQGCFLEAALQSVVAQALPVEIFVMDGGSTIFGQYHQALGASISYWRSHADNGQSAAINEGIAKGTAPYVCWINSDDGFLADGLKHLLQAIEQTPTVPAVYGRAWNVNEQTEKKNPVWVESFSELA